MTRVLISLISILVLVIITRVQNPLVGTKHAN